MKDELRDDRIDGVAGDPIRVEMELEEVEIEETVKNKNFFDTLKYTLIGAAVIGLTAFILGFSIGRNNPPSGNIQEKLRTLTEKIEVLSSEKKNLKKENQQLKRQMDHWERTYTKSLDNLSRDIKEIKESLKKR